MKRVRTILGYVLTVAMLLTSQAHGVGGSHGHDASCASPAMAAPAAAVEANGTPQAADAKCAEDPGRPSHSADGICMNLDRCAGCLAVAPFEFVLPAPQHSLRLTRQLWIEPKSRSSDPLPHPPKRPS